MNKTIRCMALLALLSFLAGAFALPVSADEAGISVDLVLPASQTDPDKNYFDLQLLPGERQELTVVVNNTGSFDIEVSVETVTASTNGNGLINYTSQPQMEEESLQYAFAQIAEVPQQTVPIPAGASEQVSVIVQMPEQPLEGVILGAIHIVQQTAAPTEGALSHQFAYAVAVQLSNSDERPPLGFELGDVFFFPQGDRAAVTAQVRNVAAAVAKPITINAVLYDMEGISHLYQSMEDMEMAPNSALALLLKDDVGTGLDAGDYRLEVNVSSGEREWKLEYPVAITKEQLKGLAYERTTGAALTGLPRVILFILGTIVSVAVLIVLGLFIYIRIQNRKYYKYMREMQKKQQERQRELDERREGGSGQ